MCRVFYKHAAPLGLNAESNLLAVIADHGGVVSRFLIRASAQSVSSAIQINGTCRPSGALWHLVCRVFYKHAAPLGLNAESNLLACHR